MKRIIFSILFISAFIGACSSTPSISSSDRARLGSVVINSTVFKSQKMSYMGPGSAAGYAFGAIGAAISAGSQGTSGEALQKFAEQNNVSIEKIVLDEATNAFRNSGKVTLQQVKTAGSTTLDIVIVDYGFLIPNGFSTKLVPALNIRFNLVDASGRTIWSKTDFVTPLGNPASARSLDEFRSNPKLIEESWRLAARQISANVVKKL